MSSAIEYLLPYNYCGNLLWFINVAIKKERSTRTSSLRVPGVNSPPLHYSSCAHTALGSSSSPSFSSSSSPHQSPYHLHQPYEPHPRPYPYPRPSPSPHPSPYPSPSQLRHPRESPSQYESWRAFADEAIEGRGMDPLRLPRLEEKEIQLFFVYHVLANISRWLLWFCLYAVDVLMSP